MKSKKVPDTATGSELRVARNRTSPLSRVALIGFGFLLFFSMWAVTECALSVLGIGDTALYQDPYVGFAPGSSVFREQTLADGSQVWATSPSKLSFFNPQEFPREKAPDAYRIFALGGSTTAGRPYDHQVAYCRWLQLFLEGSNPSRKWEAVNAGGISYASYRLVVLMKELVTYSPDLFIVYTGHNEFLEERTYSDIIHQPRFLKRVSSWLSGWRSTSLLRQGWIELSDLYREELDADVETRLDVWTGLQQFHRDDSLKREILEHFDQNLRQIVRIADDYDIDLIFVKPVSNLKDFSPFKSEHSQELTAATIDHFQNRFTRGKSALEANDPQTALAFLSEAAGLDSSYAEVHFRLGQAYLALGNYERARHSFVEARDLDVAPLRAPSEIVETVEAIARETGVPLIDLPALMEDESRRRYGHPILGNEVFLDHVHPDFDTHTLIAQKVLELLQQKGLTSLDSTWPVKQRKIVSRTISSLDRRYYAQRDLNLAKVLSWAGKIEESEAPLLRAAAVLENEPEVHLILGVVYEKTGRLQEALREHQRAIELQHDMPKAHFNLGVVYGRLDLLAEGIDSFEEAIRLEPEFAQAHTNLGILRRRRGDLEGAVRALEKALQLNPDAAEIYDNLGVAFRRQKRWSEAIECFKRSIELAPTDPVAATDLAITYAQQGRLEEAVTELEKVVERHPHHAEAHYNLGVIHVQTQREPEAIGAYLATLEADPEYYLAHNNVAILFAKSGQVEKALAHFVRATEINPAYAEGYLNLAVVLDATGRKKEAVEARARAKLLEARDHSRGGAENSDRFG